MRQLQRALDALSRDFDGGCLQFTAGNQSWCLGNGEPSAEVVLREPSVLRRILRHPSLAFGERYMAQDWNPRDGKLLQTLAVAVRFDAYLAQHSWNRMLRWLARLNEFSPPALNRRRVEHHYNVDAELYRSFLDREMFYSCAYFERDDLSLEDAQQAKCRLIARKLDLKPGSHVLDIGCGWGSLAIYLARHHDVHVTGITLSSEQLEAARQRVAALGLSDRIALRLEDYRQTRGSFDAIVSVGMFEHVGRPQYPRFFRQVRKLLKHDGTALLHTIGRESPPAVGNPWISKYIFPGGYIPAASEVSAAIEHSELLMTDFEVWRLHYATTLAHWQARFQADREHHARRLGEAFCRMWEFYLSASEAAFRWGDLVVFQIQMTRALQRLPLTRNYLYEPATP